MAAFAKFTCPNDGETFNKLWSLGTDVACPRCGVVWKTEMAVGGARITEDSGRKEPPEPLAESGDN
jgi:predicted RNA-binding Zn-ribbon protein involved in translation (DUF1610 family)